MIDDEVSMYHSLMYYSYMSWPLKICFGTNIFVVAKPLTAPIELFLVGVRYD
jgi:hypothetical protein